MLDVCRKAEWEAGHIEARLGCLLTTSKTHYRRIDRKTPIAVIDYCHFKFAAKRKHAWARFIVSAWTLVFRDAESPDSCQGEEAPPSESENPCAGPLSWSPASRGNLLKSHDWSGRINFVLWQCACIFYNVYYSNRVTSKRDTMKVSQKGLYALQAMMVLARRYTQGAIRIRDIAYEENLPEKFLELILLELKNARLVESVRGAKGGYRLRRAPSEIRLSEIIRLIDGPLAPFGDAEQLRVLIDRDADHSALYKVFLEVRDAAAGILDSTTLADLISRGPAGNSLPKAINRKTSRKKKAEPSVLPILAGASVND